MLAVGVQPRLLRYPALGRYGRRIVGERLDRRAEVVTFKTGRGALALRDELDDNVTASSPRSCPPSGNRSACSTSSSSP
jgi:hypothetical protein